MKRKSEIALFVALGAAIGAIFTLLFATDKGKNIQKNLTSEFDLLKEKVKTFFN